MNFKIIQKKNIWVSISVILFIITGTALMVWGLKLGIDFTGGSLMEVKFLAERPSVNDVYNKMNSLNLGSLTVQPVGETDMILRFQDSSEVKHQEVLKNLKEIAISIDSKDTKDNNQEKIEEIRFESVGPSIGSELRKKAFYSIFWVLVGIVVYISIVFRQVSKPVESWKYGMSALIAMVHDTIITLGVFAILGKFYGVEINTPFVAAILTVVGYSVHDTIVVFDRTRENLPKSHENFEGTVNTSINQTLGRSINTSLTVLLTLIAIIIFGGESMRTFALALTVGIFFGTYSSIFLASPMLVYWEKFKK
jgi:preprotein translocase subunit SecF